MAASRRYGTIIRHLRDDPDTASELAGRLSDDLLAHLGCALSDEQRRRAVESGDQEAIIAEGFEVGFGRDGLAVLPWIQGPFIVCPGGLIAKNRHNHRCRFVSVENTWIWESHHLVDEVKRSTPGVLDGFRAVALLPVQEGIELDVVSGLMKSGQHGLERVVSLIVRRGELREVSQRVVTSAGMK